MTCNLQGNLFVMGIHYTIIFLFVSACVTAEKGTLGSLGELKIKIDRDTPIYGARDKAMDNYAHFTNAAPKDSLRVEALRRLADLELERSEENFQQELAKLSVQKAVNVKAQQQLKGVNYTKAIKLYEDALQTSGREDAGEMILYQLSKAYEQAGKPRKALGALERLIDQFPDIDNRDEVHFRRGELMFSLKMYKKAEIAYTQAMLVNPLSQFYDKALSQRGWAAYKQQDFTKALYSFFNFVDRKLRNASGEIGITTDHLTRGQKELLEDAFRAIILSFMELGGADATAAHFKKFGHRRYESKVYKAMGDFYLDKSRIIDAETVYQSFVKQYKDHPNAPVFDLYAIKALEIGGFVERVFEAKLAFAQKYRVNGPYWQRQQHTDKAKLGQLIAANIEDISSHYHAKAQKTKKPADYQQAIFWYRQYLKSFPDSEKSQKLNFLLAETLFENKQYESATKEYIKSAYRYPKMGQDAEAGYAALVAYVEGSKQLTGKAKVNWDRLSVDSAIRFGESFPSDPRSPAVVTKAAEGLYALKKFEQAAVAARITLGLKAKTNAQMRRTAWLIIAQSKLQQGQFTEAESAFKVALKLSEQDPKVRQSVIEGLAAAIYKRAEQLRDSGDTKGAIAEFHRVGQVTPDSKVNIRAKFDIAASYMKARDWQTALEHFLRFRQTYPAHPLQVKVTERLTAIYLKTNKSILAAKEFERLAKLNPNTNSKRDILWRIAGLYEQAGETDDMVDTYLHYIREFPSPIEPAIEARQKLADIYKKSGKEAQYHFWLKEIIAKDRIASSNRTERTRYLAAKAAFVLAQPVLRSFQTVQLVAPLKKNLAKKKQRMEDAVEAFTVAANYGVAEITTASVYRLGEIYSRFGQDLLNSERPKDLSGEARTQYDILLEEQAYPFEEKSIDIHESNVKRVREGTYDEWVKKSFAVLKVLRPARYGKAERSEVVADITH